MANGLFQRDHGIQTLETSLTASSLGRAAKAEASPQLREGHAQRRRQRRDPGWVLAGLAWPRLRGGRRAGTGEATEGGAQGSEEVCRHHIWPC